MLPILDVYVVWHEKDTFGARVASSVQERLRGDHYRGLISGALEVYMRSVPLPNNPDRILPIPAPAPYIPPDPDAGTPGFHTNQRPRFLAIVPILGPTLASCLAEPGSAWFRFFERMRLLARASPDQVFLFPHSYDHDTVLPPPLWSEVCSGIQEIGHPWPKPSSEEEQVGIIEDDLIQGLIQALPDPRAVAERHAASPVPGSAPGRVTIFISHTRRAVSKLQKQTHDLIGMVRGIIQNTRLNSFFDAQDIQVGTRWEEVLKTSAARSALLVLRTDQFAERKWCLEEVRQAKEHGMSIVVLEGLMDHERRGSFILDHLPRFAIRDGDGWSEANVKRALSHLLDAELRRKLWILQEELAKQVFPTRFDGVWWTAAPPEAMTMMHACAHGVFHDVPSMHILHPEPPLNAVERSVLEQMSKITGKTLRIRTPLQSNGLI